MNDDHNNLRSESAGVNDSVQPVLLSKQNSVNARDEGLPDCNDRNGRTDTGTENNETHVDCAPNQEVTALMVEEEISNEQMSASQEKSYGSGKPKPSQRKQTRRRSMEQFWIPELIWLVLATASFIAILAILRRCEDGLQPNWKHGITLNAVAAVLATAMRAFLAAIAEEMISQTKWLWYKVSRAASHLAYFDAASRGPWGSALLFFRVNRINMASLGSVILILSLAISVFTQQAIRAIPCIRPVSGASASVPIGNMTAQLPVIRYGVVDWDVDPIVKINVINGFANPTASRPVTVTGCTTGNCSFDSVNGITYSFAGTCSKCFDTSSEITVGGTSNWTLSVTANGGSPSIYFSSSEAHLLQSSAGSINFGDQLSVQFPSEPEIQSMLPSSLANISILTATLNGCTVIDKRPNCSQLIGDSSNTNASNAFALSEFDVLAISCFIYPCIRNSFAEVRNGTLTETTMNEIILYPPEEWVTDPTAPYVGVNDPCIIGGKHYDQSNYTQIPSWGEQIQTNLSGQLVPTDCVYAMDPVSAAAISQFVASVLRGDCWSTLDVNLGGTYADEWAICEMSGNHTTNQMGDAFWLQSLYNTGNASFNSISTAFDAMMTAATDSFRLQASYGSAYNTYLADYPTPVNSSLPTIAYGSVYQTDVCVQVNWQWLSLPATLLFLTAALLVGNIIASLRDRQRYPIWKSSILPLLYAAPGSELVALSSDLVGLSEDARSRRLQLVRGEDRCEFVQT